MILKKARTNTKAARKKMCQKSRILLTLLQVIKHNSLLYFAEFYWSMLLPGILSEIHYIKRHCDLIGHKASTLLSSVAFYWVFWVRCSSNLLKALKLYGEMVWSSVTQLNCIKRVDNLLAKCTKWTAYTGCLSFSWSLG